MIENDHQLAITKREANRFEEAISAHRTKTCPDDVDPVIWKASLEGMESLLETLRREIQEYEAA
ncbi:hypothetical protein OIU34_23135 [Pararhizobium sp. BT-229]|uniref:hypothetical protein n=1 Tax=Pararhizobium sp. BT-229 TaxID=2986923 RepID=UPI0021F6B3B0|nr:hypothetical protein [Pararhizobium sp. BT-229]MCV9964790.1 hypothetical protein [Pararhizobium sp. BT-229]